jgi:hypothetical protein
MTVTPELATTFSHLESSYKLHSVTELRHPAARNDGARVQMPGGEATDQFEFDLSDNM